MEFSVLSTLLFAGGLALLLVLAVFMAAVYDAAREAREYYRRLNDEARARQSVPQP